MHFTPYHKNKSWQRFFFGIFIGAVLSYCILIFMYGKMYEQLIEVNYDLQAQITELQSRNEALLKDNESIAEKNKVRLTVERIEITIPNQEQLRLDRLIILQLNEMIKKEINHVIGQDIYIVSESDQLLLSTLENKAFTIDDFTYYFEVKKLTIAHTLKLTMIAKISE